MSWFSIVLDWWVLIANHIWMFFEKIWQLIIQLFQWIFSLFSVSWNYEFISLFSNIFIWFFIIWIVALIASYFLWNFKIVKDWIWNNSVNSIVTMSVKTWIFIFVFISLYFLIEWIIPKIIINVQTIKENWMTLSAKNEWFFWEENEDLSRKIIMVWWFLNWIDYSNSTFSTQNEIWWAWFWWYAFKEFSLKKTKINFSPKVEKWSWKSIVEYSMWYVNQQWELIVWNSKLNLFSVQDLLNQWKDSIECNTTKNEESKFTKLENITNFWWDIYWYLLTNVKDPTEVKNNVYISDLITDISKLYTKIKKKYIFTNANSIWEIFNEENWNVYVNNHYKNILQKIVCISDFSKIEWDKDNKKEEKKEEKQNETNEQSEKKNENKTETKNEESLTIQTIKKNLSEIKSYLLFLDRLSEKSNKWIKDEDNKFLFIMASLQNFWFWSIMWHETTSDIKQNLKLKEYVRLSFPLIIDIKNWDKIVNNWICYNYIFDPDLSSKFKWNWYNNLLQILKTWCWWNFWWIYDYTWNNIDQLWTQYYKRIIKNINDWKTLEKTSTDELWKTQWYFVYESYWSLSWIEPTWLQPNNSVYIWLWETKENLLWKKDYLPEYEERIKSVSWIIKLINSYKNFMFSLFLYILPWVFIVLILKFVKLHNN